VRRGIVALAVLFLAAHLPFLPPTLEDIDSVNFALGVRQFDVARHQPHPPGYPVFIALAKGSTAVLRAAGASAPAVRGLSMWSACAGAALVLLLFALVAALDESDRRAFWTTAIVALSPLYWFTALRPLSDMTGLALAAGGQALIVSAIRGRGSPNRLITGAFIAGVAIGARSQTFLLTLPLLALALAWPNASLRARARLAGAAALGIGVLAWAVPLIAASGGPSAYAAALGSQASEDFSGVVMLWTTRRPRVALDALKYSFLWPWGSVVTGGVVAAIAAVGGARLAWRRPRVLLLLIVGFLPYAVFHLLFQETVTTRYALPLLLPIGYLAVFALDGLPQPVLPLGAAALAVISTLATAPAVLVYARTGSPAFRALEDAAHDPETHVVGLHAVARRAVDWLAADLPVRVLRAPHGREWLALVEQWKADPDTRVSFVADPRRTDLALIDPRARSAPVPYRWGFVEPPFVGGARPGDSDVYVMEPPGWMLDRGWALTAEVAGVTARDGWGPSIRPSAGWIRTRPGAALMIVGGRHLGAATDPRVSVTLTLAGRPLDAFEAAPGFFFRLVPLPASSLAGAPGYVPLEVRSQRADGGGGAIAVSLEQFDLQPEGVPMVGVAEGWQEPEYNPLTARAWRWTSERATLWVRPIGRDVTLRLVGESPLRYYDRAPKVIVSAGGREIARFSPASDFTQEVVLPAGALASADGRVVISSDEWFVPSDRGGPPDQRHLALRIYSFDVR